MHLASQPLTRVVIAIFEYDGPKAMCYIVLEIAFIHRLFLYLKYPVPIHLTIDPLTFIVNSFFDFYLALPDSSKI